MSPAAKIDLTLQRISKLAALFPSYTRPTCHITGTNGKGSVSALLSSMLLASQPPLQVGRFNSPHLISMRDSIVINDKPVAADLYSVIRSEVESVDKNHDIGASNFEKLTLTALLAFERVGVDIVVAEVGMGGRLDATNVIPDECILVSALTSVDLDHQAFLGATVAEIAKEKAGIARKGRPFVVGRQRYPEVDEVVRNVVAQRGGLVQPVSTVVEAIGSRSYIPSTPTCSIRIPSPLHVRIAMPCFSEEIHSYLPLHGDHQLENLITATTIVSTLVSRHEAAGSSITDLRKRITPESISRGIRSTVWPGRLSFHNIYSPHRRLEGSIATSPKLLPVLVDGAHNPASASALASFLSNLLAAQEDSYSTDGINRESIPLTMILALSDSPPKTPLQTLTPLLKPLSSNVRVETNVAVVRFTPPEEMPWVESIAPSELRKAVLTLLPDAKVWTPGGNEEAGQDDLCRAFEWAASREEQLVIVTGSLYLVADFYRLLRDGNILA